MKISWVGAATTFVVAGILSAGGWAKDAPRETVRAYLGGRAVSIEYGRPSLQGRDLLTLIEPGQLWRLGAGAPTTIQCRTDLKFGGFRVPKGKHILIVRYIRPLVWSLVVLSAPAIDYAPRSRIAEVLMRFEGAQNPVQELRIHLSGQKEKGAIQIAWGAYRLSTQFALAP